MPFDSQAVQKTCVRHIVTENYTLLHYVHLLFESSYHFCLKLFNRNNEEVLVR